MYQYSKESSGPFSALVLFFLIFHRYFVASYSYAIHNEHMMTYHIDIAPYGIIL